MFLEATTMDQITSPSLLLRVPMLHHEVHVNTVAAHTSGGRGEWDTQTAQLPPRPALSRLVGPNPGMRKTQEGLRPKPGDGREGARSPGRTSRTDVPFRRVTSNATKRQMVQAMRSTGAREGKDAFKRSSTARSQLAHQLRHMGFSGASDKALHDPVEGEFGLQQAAARALAQSAAAKRAFQEALVSCRVRPRALKAMFVGQGRAGKTSTLKALTGQEFQEQEVSTHGLHTEAMPLVNTEATLDVQSSWVSQWQLVNRSEHEIHGAELEKSCAAFVAERLANLKEAPLASADSPDLGERPEVATKMSVDLVAKMIASGEEEEEEPVMLKTWDFGGQREYYVMHHLFLTNRGIYIVVTRLDAWLRRPLEEESVASEAKSYSSEDGGAFEPPLEALTFWLSSIHVHAPDALVFIVGSHADVVAESLPEVEACVEEEVVRLMERVPGLERQVVVNSNAGLCFFPVDNRSGAGISELRQAIDREA
ncbi:unnamed protein product, partial [Effrenium voratum]